MTLKRRPLTLLFSAAPVGSRLSPRTWGPLPQSRATTCTRFHGQFSRQKCRSGDESESAAEETVPHGRQQQLGHREGLPVSDGSSKHVALIFSSDIYQKEHVGAARPTDRLLKFK